MSGKTYIVSLSLTGAAVAGCFWMLMGGTRTEDTSPVKTGTTFHPKTSPVVAKTPVPGKRTAKSTASAGTPPHSSVAARSSLPPPATEPVTPEARAARVEQEANHELRRLVTLLNLDETQQDQVFQTLARNSPYWTAEMQVGSTVASTTGKRSSLNEGVSGVVIPGAETTVPGKSTATAPSPSLSTPPVTAVAPVPGAADNAKINDPMTAIMSLLTPEQQAVLIESETDKTAWWAEVLPDLLPPDDVPAIDGTTPGNQETYEGEQTLQ